MMLLVDIGNSQIKWQESDYFTDAPRSFAYDAESIHFQLDTNLKSCTSIDGGVVIVSVGCEEINRKVEKWFIEQCEAEVQFLSSATKWGTLRNGYDKPETLGVDRWYALVGAASRYTYPFMVCDIGSAVTIDLVDHQGSHLGGFITPGLDMMTHSLNTTAGINIDSLSSKSRSLAIPSNTQTAIKEGCMQSVTALIDSVKRKYASGFDCILTGGHAEVIFDLLESTATVDKNLIFYGILSEIQNR